MKVRKSASKFRLTNYAIISYSIYFFVIPSLFFLNTKAYAQLSKGSWPMFGHDLQHTGRSSYTGDQRGQQIWEFMIADGSTSSSYRLSPVIGPDGTIFFGASRQETQVPYTYQDTGFRLYALTSGGKVKWIYESNDCYYNCKYSTPAIGSDGTVYITKSDGLYAISNGTLKWVAGILTFNWDFLSSPAVAPDGTIYVGGYGLYAVSPAGGVKWRYETSGVVSSPSIDKEGTIYFADASGIPLRHGPYVYAIFQDGSLKWKYEVAYPGHINSSAAIGDDGTVYIGVEYGEQEGLLAINQDGSLKWHYPISNGVSSTPSLAIDGTIYVDSCDGAGNVYALYPNGTTKWTYSRGGGIIKRASSPAIGSDGTIYVGGLSGKLFAISPYGGGKWSYTFSSTLHTPSPGSPAVGPDGTIYVFADKLVFDPGDRFIYNLYAIGNFPKAYFSANTQKGRIPLSVSFTDQSLGPVLSWLWDFGDGTKSTEQNPKHTYNKPGTYNVSLTIEGSDGADIATKENYISVFNKSNATIISIPLLLLDKY